MPTPEKSIFRNEYQKCVEVYPGWKLGSSEPEFVSIIGARTGLELTLPGNEIDPDDWEDITDEQREELRVDEVEARLIFACIKSVQDDSIGQDKRF